MLIKVKTIFNHLKYVSIILYLCSDLIFIFHIKQ